MERVVKSVKPKRPGVRRVSAKTPTAKGAGVKMPRSLHMPKMADILKKIL